MGSEASFFELVLQASLIVQFVMLMLLAASVMSWAIILRKRTMIIEATNSSDEFETSFWSGGDLTGIYEVILKINDVVVQAKEVTLDGGDSQSISFRVTYSLPCNQSVLKSCRPVITFSEFLTSNSIFF